MVLTLGWFEYAGHKKSPYGNERSQPNYNARFPVSPENKELCLHCIDKNLRCEQLPLKYQSQCNTLKQQIHIQQIDACQIDTILNFPPPITNSVIKTLKKDCADHCISYISEHAKDFDRPFHAD